MPDRNYNVLLSFPSGQTVVNEIPADQVDIFVDKIALRAGPRGEKGEPGDSSGGGGGYNRLVVIPTKAEFDAYVAAPAEMVFHIAGISHNFGSGTVDPPIDPPVDPPVLAPLATRAALLSSASAMHSGHSLTDAYVNVTLKQVFVSMFPDTVWEQHIKATVPGSATRFRWDNAQLNDPNPRDNMDQADLLMITERGLDIVGVAPITNGVFLEDIFYELRFAERAISLGKEVVLWSIWPSIVWPNWQGILADYEARFKIRREYIEWKLKQLHPQWDGTIWLCPGHLFMQRVMAELPPGVSTFAEMFSDDIHTGDMLSHGLGIFVLTFLYKENMTGRTDTYLPPSTTQAQDLYFKDLSWRILSDYAPAGMGGENFRETYWDGHDWYPQITIPAHLDTVPFEDGIPWDGTITPPIDPPIDPPVDPPAGFQPSDISGLVATLPAVTLDRSSVPDTALTPPIPAGPIYGIMAVTVASEQAGTEAIMLRLKNGGQDIIKLNFRADINNIVMESSASGGNHTSTMQMLPLDQPAYMEFWIDADGGRIETAGNDHETPSAMTPSSLPATHYSVGEHQWGAATFNGTIHGAVFYDHVPTLTERASLRQWAQALYT